MERSLQNIQHYCADHFGIHVDTLSEREWKRKLSQRLQATVSEDYATYFQLLKSSPNEFQELVEALIVPETWFYREKAAYEYLTHYCANLAQRPIHLLSVPCGSGEEVYTLVMAMLEKGFSSDDFVVDGVDISKKALKHADEGIFHKRSFRSKLLSYREKYFDEIEGNYRVKGLLRDPVHWFWGNMMEATSLKILKSKYEVIFCRNLLIYLHDEARKQVFHLVKELLAPGGLLFVAPAEVDVAKHHGFCLAGPIRSCALELAKPHVEMEKPLSMQYEEHVMPSKHVEEEQKLSQAHLVADSGDYIRAEQLCLEHLKKHGDDANAYYLLGVISHAKNQLEVAKDYFNRAIYLEPDHADALFYLALLAEREGDATQAALLRQRARHRKN